MNTIMNDSLNSMFAVLKDPAFQARVIISILLIIFIWLMRSLLLRIVLRRNDNAGTNYQWRKISSYISFIVIILALGMMWLSDFKNIATFLGLVSAGLAIALQEPIKGLVGWVFIIIRQPFKLGDRVQVGNLTGDLVDQRLFHFSMIEVGNWVQADQSTGRVIHIPNGKIFTENLINYSGGFNFIWNEIRVMVTFESDWKKAKKLLEEIALKHGADVDDKAREQIKEASRKLLVHYSNLQPTIYTSVAESGILLTIRYICEPRQRRNSEHDIWEDVLDVFEANPDIDFAYPTRRAFNNQIEGKITKNQNQ